MACFDLTDQASELFLPTQPSEHFLLPPCLSARVLVSVTRKLTHTHPALPGQYQSVTYLRKLFMAMAHPAQPLSLSLLNISFSISLSLSVFLSLNCLSLIVALSL